MKVTGDWIARPATRAVFRTLAEGGYPAWFVGGCVRNALIGAPVKDIDIATPARPEKVAELGRAGGLKVVPTGIDHGTVTVVAEGIGHEVTTFRRDVATDGRRAVVAFTDNMVLDAKRRDFSMNALYADIDGNVVDPLGGGLADLQARRVRFIEDADARITEDYLRILRYFRFHAWYGDPSGGMDQEALAAISANIDGLDTLSAERVGAELLKLLAAPDPAPAVAVMERTGVLAHVLPGASARDLAALVAVEARRAPDPIRRLAVLGGPDPAERLRLSRADAKRRALLVTLAGTDDGPAVIAYRHGVAAAIDAAMLRAAMTGTRVAADLEAEAERGAQAVFPVRSADLMPDLTGPALGECIKALEARWVASDFALTRAELLADKPDYK